MYIAKFRFRICVDSVNQYSNRCNVERAPIVCPAFVGVHEGLISVSYGHEHIGTTRSYAVRVVLPGKSAEGKTYDIFVRIWRNVEQFIEASFYAGDGSDEVDEEVGIADC